MSTPSLASWLPIPAPCRAAHIGIPVAVVGIHDRQDGLFPRNLVDRVDLFEVAEARIADDVAKSREGEEVRADLPHQGDEMGLSSRVAETERTCVFASLKGHLA